MQQFLGPFHIRLVLDPDQIDERDPGNGTPAMVYYQGGSATFYCAANEGEVIKRGRAINLPQACVNWLWKQEQNVDAMYQEALCGKE